MVKDTDITGMGDAAILDDADPETAARNAAQEDVLNTPDLVGGVMSQSRLLEQKLQAEFEREYGSGKDAQRKREEAAEEFEEAVGQWRIDRGPEYVAAFKALKQTGENIATGQKVFEGDWFRDLQNDRAQKIARLQEREKTSGLSPETSATLRATIENYEGDERVSKNWKRLSEDYLKIKTRESSCSMSTQEVRDSEADLKRRLFEELDAASPELREVLLADIAKNDPAFAKEYATRNDARTAPVVLNSAAQDYEDVVRIGKVPQDFDPDLTGDLVGMAAGSSAAKKYGFENVSAATARSEFNTAACGSLSSAEPKKEEPAPAAKNSWGFGA